MKTTSNQKSYSKYTFRNQTGYIVAPWISGTTHEWVTIRHSASVPPWVDHDVHLHTDSEEYYFLLLGELNLLVNGSVITLKPQKVLAIRPKISHAVIGGNGPIEHFVIRMPGFQDRQTVGDIPAKLSLAANQDQRELPLEWGSRISLTEVQHQNCWLFGVGQARFHSEYMCLAYLNLAAPESIKTDSHPHRLHFHQKSWEYYIVLRGTRILQVEGELVEIREGEILEVPPCAKHVLHTTHPPFEGITFRVPRLNDKVEC